MFREYNEVNAERENLNMKEFVKQLAAEQKETLRETRHYLHMHPELSFEEYETSAYIKAKLKELGIPLAEGISGTSVVGIIKGEQDGPVIACRADFDALPVNEENDLPYKSVTPNVMHACGHDTHAATLLSFAEILAKHPELVRGTVKLVFQSAEEKLPGGAVQLVKDGVMDDVDFGFGFHSAAGVELGKVEIAAIDSAAVGTYEVKIHGKGGHGSNASNTINPMPIACMVGTAINQIRPEKISPLNGTTVTVAYIHGGTVPNIIPAEAVLGGNLRVLHNEDLDTLMSQIEKISKAIVEAWGATCEVDFIRGYPANINDPKLIELARETVSELGYEVVVPPQNLGAEDFAYYALEKPCVYIHVGGANPDVPQTYSPHHSKSFLLDEDMLDIALECELAFYLKATGQA